MYVYICLFLEASSKFFFLFYWLCSQASQQCSSLPCMQKSPFFLLPFYYQCFSRAGMYNIGRKKMVDEYGFEIFIPLFPACCVPCAQLKLSYLCCHGSPFFNCSNPVFVGRRQQASEVFRIVRPILLRLVQRT